MVYKFYFILILILPWLKGGNVNFPLRYIIYIGLATCLLSLIYKNNRNILKNSFKTYFSGFVVLILFICISYENGILSENLNLNKDYLKSYETTNDEINREILSTTENAKILNIENAYYSLFNLKNEIYYKFKSNDKSSKDKINFIYKQLFTDYSPFIPILNSYSLSNMITFTTYLICILISFTTFYVKSNKSFRKFSLLVFINAGILCIFGMLDKIDIISFNPEKPLLGIWQVTDSRYYFATFTYKNHWGAFALLSFIHGSAYLVSNIRNRRTRIFNTSCILLLSITIILSLFYVESRSSILVLFIFTFSLIYIITRFKSYLIIFTISFCSLFLIIDDRSSDSSIINRTLNQFDSIDQEKYPFRFLLWSDILDQIRIKTFWGYGFNSYGKINPLFQSEHTVNERYIVTNNAHTDFTPAIKSAHSDILQNLSEFGFITYVFVFFPIFFFVLRETLFAKGYYVRVLALGCLSYIFYCLIDLPNSSFANLNVFICTLVIIFAYSRCSSRNKRTQKNS